MVEKTFPGWRTTALKLMVLLGLIGWSIVGSDTAQAQSVGSADIGLAAAGRGNHTAASDRSSTGLSAINWDEDPIEAHSSGGQVLSGSWEDDETDDEDDERVTAEAERIRQEIAALDARERLTHLWGFALFVAYLLGGILTAYFTRNRKVAKEYPPELMILLHTFWPIELLLLPIVGRKVKPL